MLPDEESNYPVGEDQDDDDEEEDEPVDPDALRHTLWGANDPQWPGGNTEPIVIDPQADKDTEPLLPAVKPSSDPPS